MLHKPMKHLHGKHILLTRTPEQNKETAKLVTSLGAIPESLPCTSIISLPQPIQQAWAGLQEFPENTDVIFSSRNGVQAVAEHVNDFQQLLSRFRVIAVGEKTAQALKNYGIHAGWMPNQASQQGLITDYPKYGLPKHAVFFRAETGSDALLDFLIDQGVQTTLVTAYKAILNPEENTTMIQQLQKGEIDAVLLGSARTAEFYLQKTGDLKLANHPAIAVMSPQVEKAADKLGLNVQVIAKQPSFKAMLESLNDYFATMKKG